jgi:succinate dehydrogenase / fumarate reductase cytochrome b subunit
LFIRLAEVGLIGGLLIHIVQGLSLTLGNMKKRNNKYGASPKRSNSKWYSRSMGLLGTILLLFLIMHLKHFWIVSRFDAQGGLTETKTLYHFMVEVFTSPVSVTLYVLGCISLAYHLLHGFQSAFQTFGWNHKKFMPLIKCIGVWGFGVLIPLAFAAMPLYFFFCK